ncbi:protein kinase [Nocardia sp. NPDC052566]|uniref:protein kinase domain-containing protein n=1 Tax=Nocardia sp. NPDC052566 TaxID=3364330 RepID=UPI0037C9703F
MSSKRGAASMRLDSGSVFAGYTIERILGVGGMGVVYLAHHPRLERLVALKVLSDNLGDDDRVRAKFEREAALAARLDHPNIVPVYDRSGTDADVLWISMKYIDGGDAAHLLKRLGGPVAAATAVRLLADAAHGLDYAHQHGVLHRDVKPANILIEHGDHGAERAVLTDFGIARALDDAETMTGTTATFAYVAPERFLGQQADNRADVYSLGCTFYELLTGRTPFPRLEQAALIAAHLNEPPPRPTLAHPGLPQGLDAVIGTALAKRPGDRFATCGALAEAARRVLTDLQRPTVVPPYSGPHPTYSGPHPNYSGQPPNYSGPQPIYSGPQPIHSGSQPIPVNQPIPAGPQPIPANPQPFYSGQPPIYSGPQPGQPFGGYPTPPPRPRKSLGLIAVLAVIAVSIVTAITVGIVVVKERSGPATVASPTPSRTTTTAPSPVAIQLLDDGVRIGSANAPKTIDMFNEPICPACGRLLNGYGADIERAIQSGKLAVQFHLLNFLDSSSASGNYSTRAVAATRCVAQSGAATVYLKTYQGLFGQSFQPLEKGATDHTDAELAELARTSGAAAATTDCIRSGRLMDLARATAAQGYALLEKLQRGTLSTPAVFSGIAQVDTTRPDWVTGLN